MTDFQTLFQLSSLPELRCAVSHNPLLLSQQDSKLGWPPLYRSAVYNLFSLSESLLSLGADPNQPNRLGQRALHQAAENNQLLLARLLLQHGADPNVQQNDGDTPLHVACVKRHGEMAQILLDAGADPNTPNSVFGRTPLHNACEQNSHGLVKLLVQHRACAWTRDKHGLLPADLAKDEAVVKLLGKTEKAEDRDENCTAKDSIHEPESEKAIMSSNRVCSGPQFSFGEGMVSPLFNWLSSVGMQEAFESLENHGFDDLDMMIEAMQSSTPITDDLLKRIGVSKVGIRLRLLAKLEEQCTMSSRYSLCNDKGICCDNSRKKVGKGVPLADWLRGIRLEHLATNFEQAGFDELEQLVDVMKSSFRITDELLEEEIGVKKIGHRHRILSRINSEVEQGRGLRIDRNERIAACESCYIM
jgi:hypothetical protein